MNGAVYIQKRIVSIIKNDVPNWTTLSVEIIIALLILITIPCISVAVGINQVSVLTEDIY